MALSTLAPLEAPIDEIDKNESRSERFWKRIPIVGWAISCMLWDERVRPIWLSVEAQLRSRPAIDPSIWGSEDCARVGVVVSKVAAKEMSWPSDRFIPTDPVQIVFWAHADGLDYESATLELEAELSIKIDKELAIGFQSMTLESMVSELVALVRASAIQARHD